MSATGPLSDAIRSQGVCRIAVLFRLLERLLQRPSYPFSFGYPAAPRGFFQLGVKLSGDKNLQSVTHMSMLTHSCAK